MAQRILRAQTPGPNFPCSRARARDPLLESNTSCAWMEKAITRSDPQHSCDLNQPAAGEDALVVHRTSRGQSRGRFSLLLLLLPKNLPPTHPKNEAELLVTAMLWGRQETHASAKTQTYRVPSLSFLYVRPVQQTNGGWLERFAIRLRVPWLKGGAPANLVMPTGGVGSFKGFVRSYVRSFRSEC